jgi:hypothetical protein
MRTKRISPIAVAAAAGGMIGFIAAVLLLAFANQPLSEHYLLGDYIASWAGIPTRHWIYAATWWKWDWAHSHRTPFLLLSLTLNGALWAAAAAAVARGLRQSRRFRRTVAACAMITLPLAGAQWYLKIPMPMGGNRVQMTVYTAHEPGIFLLDRIGLCCGYENSTVIRDWGEWGGYRPSALAVFLLAASNFIMYVVLAYAFRELWRRITRRSDRTRAAAPVAPG